MSRFSAQELMTWSRWLCACPLNDRSVIQDLALEILEMRRERDEARAMARTLAHAYTHDSRPPSLAVSTALAYPVVLE